jgi:GrpB-like predicted nucleotidyltransferase (UPF0157 family)
VKFFKAEEYQANVLNLYTRFEGQLRQALPAARIEHIGSSAIVGAVSKGDLDIFVAVPAEDFEASIVRIEALGFKVKQDTHRDHELCPLESQAHGIEVGVQLVVSGSKYEFFLEFRDKLNFSPQLRDEYNSLKQSCAGFDAFDYRKVKSTFIERVLLAKGPT